MSQSLGAGNSTVERLLQRRTCGFDARPPRDNPMEGAAEWSATGVEYRGARESVGVRFLHLPQCAAIVVAPQPVNSVGRVPGLHPGCGGSRPSRATGHIWGCLSRSERPPCKRAVGVRVPASPRCSRPGGIGWNRWARKHRCRERHSRQTEAARSDEGDDMYAKDWAG